MPLAGSPLTLAGQVGNPLVHGLKTKPDDLSLASAKTRMSWRELDEISTRLAAQYLAWVWNPAIESHR